MRRRALFGLWAVLSVAGAEAHEFWIEPVARLAQPGPVSSDLVIGQSFKGDVYPYLSSRFNFFRIFARGVMHDIPGDEGDLPAFHVDEAKPGLNVIAFHGKPSPVTFEDPQVFLTYLEAEGLDWVLAAHKARGLPMTGFREMFSRTVKTLVQVGPITEEDRDVVTGMPLELVAEANPYAYPELEHVPFLLLWQGEPLPGTQLSIFHDSGTITRTTVRTDAQGRATIPLAQGGRFLINAVHIREAAPELDAAWESHWASLTFVLDGR